MCWEWVVWNIYTYSLTRRITCTSTLCYFLCLYIREEQTQGVSSNEALHDVASRPTGAVTSTKQNPYVNKAFIMEETVDSSAAACSTPPDTTCQEDGTSAKQGDGMQQPEQGQE